MKLRLLLWSGCNRNCPDCVNKNWDLDNLPVCTDYSGYDQIILTGGEPMLHPESVCRIIDEIKQCTNAPIYMYTAHVMNLNASLAVLAKLDGMTLTLHDSSDIGAFNYLNSCLHDRPLASYWATKSLRLSVFNNVFNNVSLRNAHVGDYNDLWTVKTGREYLPDCPLPTDEVFLKYGGKN